MNMEHRCGHRRAITAAVIIRTANGVAARGSITNVSASGALIITHLPAPIHGRVLVQFLDLQRIPGAPRAMVTGEIIRHTPEGFAIEWAQFSPVVIRSLLRELGGELTNPKIATAR